MNKRIWALIIATAILLSVAACLIIFLAGGDDGNEENILLETDRGYDYSDIDSRDAELLINLKNAFSTIYISYGEFDHRDPEKRAEMVLKALDEELLKAVDTDDRRTDAEGFDKTRDIIYYCYYAVVSEGQTDAGKVVYTNYMSSDKAVSLQVGLEAEDETLNAYIYKLIKDGHYDFSEGVYTTTTSGSVKEGATIYVSYTKTYSAVVDGQTGTATDTAVYHKLDATATGAEKIFYDKLVGKTLAYKHTASSDAIKFNFDSTNNVEMTFKDENIDGNDDATGLTQAAFDAAYPVVSYTAYTAHFACEGNLKDYSIHGVKYGTTTETTVDLYTGAAADNAKVKLTADTKLDYYIFPTGYVKPPEVNAENIIKAAFTSTTADTALAMALFGENYISASQSSSPSQALDSLYGAYSFYINGKTLPFDDFCDEVESISWEIKHEKSVYEEAKSELAGAARKLEEAYERYIKESDWNAEHDYKGALEEYYHVRYECLGERSPDAATTPGSAVEFDSDGRVIYSISEATQDSLIGRYPWLCREMDNAIEQLLSAFDEERIVDGYKFYYLYKKLENNYNKEIACSIEKEVEKILLEGVKVKKLPEKEVDRIYNGYIETLRGKYDNNTPLSSGLTFSPSGSIILGNAVLGQGNATYQQTYGSFERFMTEYAVAEYFGLDGRAFSSYAEADAAVKAEAEREVAKNIIYVAIADELGVKPTNKEFETYVKKLKESYESAGLGSYAATISANDSDLYLSRIKELVFAQIISGCDIKGAPDSHGYYVTYRDYTRDKNGSASMYIRAVVEKQPSPQR